MTSSHEQNYPVEYYNTMVVLAKNLTYTCTATKYDSPEITMVEGDEKIIGNNTQGISYCFSGFYLVP